GQDRGGQHALTSGPPAGRDRGGLQDAGDGAQDAAFSRTGSRTLSRTGAGTVARTRSADAAGSGRAGAGRTTESRRVRRMPGAFTATSSPRARAATATAAVPAAELVRDASSRVRVDRTTVHEP